MRALVTIDGFDGSGKSTLARRLAEALGPRASLLSVDDFRLAIDWTREDRSPLELHYEDRYDLAALERCIAAFEAGEARWAVPRFDGAAETPGEPEIRSFAEVDHLIVEGVFVQRAARSQAALQLWIDVDEEVARRRMLERDGKKGRTAAEVLSRIEARYRPAHLRYLAEHRPRDRAALIIDNTDPRAPKKLRVDPPSDQRLAIAWTAALSLFT